MADKKKMVEAAAPAADKKKALETCLANIEKTYGKGIVQTVMGLGDDGILSVTTDRYYTPSGNCIHGIGIEPDYNVEMDTEKTAYLSTLDKSDDDQLKEAVKILKEGR